MLWAQHRPGRGSGEPASCFDTRTCALARAFAPLLRWCSFAPARANAICRQASQAAIAASMISGYRTNNGLTPVSIDPELMKLAEAQAQAMASHDALSHDIARSFHDRLKGGGYRAHTAAENVGAGYHTLAQAFSGWRDSPPHRANMLLKGATRMGIAAAYAPKSKYKVFWALILAEPDERRG